MLNVKHEHPLNENGIDRFKKGEKYNKTDIELLGALKMTRQLILFDSKLNHTRIAMQFCPH